MNAPRPRALHPLSFVRALRARPRLVGCALIGAIVDAAVIAVFHLAPAVAALVAWNAGALLYLVIAWRIMRDATVHDIRERALQMDEGRTAILVVVVVAALAVLLALGTQLAQVKDIHGPARAAHVALAALTVLSSWLFTQVLFAMHYAHDFYIARMRGAQDPLSFPGTRDPSYADFFHFSCVIGTASQTADISFNGSALRPVGTLHCVVAFFFNATLLALTINIAAGLLL